MGISPFMAFARGAFQGYNEIQRSAREQMQAKDLEKYKQNIKPDDTRYFQAMGSHGPVNLFALDDAGDFSDEELFDKDMARRIANQFEKHGEKTKHNFMANTSQWDDVAAVNAFGAALNKDINITIVTPGLGDTPKWMSTELGSTFAQFKKFAMSSTQRMLMRGMQERDLDFLFGAMLLMGSGMLIDSVYHKFRFNRDYSKLSLTQKLLNAFDRSGLAGIYTDINKAIETLTDNRIGIGPLLGESKPYGSSMRWKMGTVFGPTGGQIYNIADILFDVGGLKVDDKLPELKESVGLTLLEPHINYTNHIFSIIKESIEIKGIAHITGGGLIENIPRILPVKTNVLIDTASWPVPPIFNIMKKIGKVESKEMFRSFNMGIGMIVIVNHSDYNKVKNTLRPLSKVYKIGKVESGEKRVLIQ